MQANLCILLEHCDFEMMSDRFKVDHPSIGLKKATNKTLLQVFNLAYKYKALSSQVILKNNFQRNSIANMSAVSMTKTLS